LKIRHIYNVCTGIKTKVSKLINTIKTELKDKNLSVKFVAGTSGDQYIIIGDNTKLKSLIGEFEFTNLENGIEKFIKSHK